MPIKVAFLTFYIEAWDALDQIWRIMALDPRFEVSVYSIPRKLTGDEGFGGEDRVSDFFTEHGIPHTRLSHPDFEEGLAVVRAAAPDFVFVNYPWRRNYPPAYRPERLAEFSRIAYVPYYSMPLVNEPGETGVAGHLYEQKTHQLASLVFTQDPAVVAAYARTDRGNAHVHLTGTPKIDHLVQQAAEGSGRWPIAARKPGPNQPVAGRNYRIVWAPHHSYSAGWLNFGRFSETYRGMLSIAASHPEIDFVLRPHPFLFGTLVERGVISARDFENWLEDWNDLTNTTINTDGDYAELFKATDLMVTDGISFIGEYPIVTGRPTVFLEKLGHWEFSPLGELAAAANIRLTDFAAFEALLDEIRTEGLPDYSAEIAKLKAAASPYPGKAAVKIVETVAEASIKGMGLVDPAAVKTLAWEFRSGREPQPE